MPTVAIINFMVNSAIFAPKTGYDTSSETDEEDWGSIGAEELLVSRSMDITYARVSSVLTVSS